MVEENENGRCVINQPAGHLENNESLIDAVIRETLEETRWEFTPRYICGIYQWLHNDETYLRFCFVGEVFKEHTELKLDADIERALWLSEKEIREHNSLRSPLVMKSMDDYLAGMKFPLSLIQNINIKKQNTLPVF